MKVTQDLALKQSMTMTHEMRFAIEMLTMNALEIEQLIDDELEKNPCLEESDDYASFAERTNFDRDSLSSHDVALLKSAATTDFRYELIRQIRQSHFNCFEQLIGEFIVNNLDDDGFLTDSDDVAAIMFESLGIFPE